eukprot:TRINITY_DN25703_c0_g1_i2.p1 TRINITY_DN25703_c0_g1~~TRINITY_DN25703_c0_g1_i2.p1  ORF type:complete len:159 (-),score=17.91 TRINITY_DN25703_c0_g1_i2:5-481(-)
MCIRDRVFASPIKKAEIPEVMAFLAERFVNTESTTQFLKISQPKYLEKLINYQNAYIEPMLSIVARNDLGQIVGATMAHEFDQIKRHFPVEIPKEFGPIAALWEQLGDHYRIYLKKNGLTGRIVRFSEGAAINEMRGKNMFKYLKYVSYNLATPCTLR